MKSAVEVACPACEEGFEIPYVLLGAKTLCPNCDRTVIPEVCVGTRYPRTGYQLKYSDFLQLLEQATGEMDELLGRWNNYKIERNEEVKILSAVGASVDPLVVHREIQEDASKQRAIYQLAMTHWR